MAPLALLGLLAAAALAGASAVPVEKDHVEEMVTQCIVEVLSNALSKPNAPPINPECKEILKKSGKNDRDKNEDKQLEVRHLKDPAENEKHHIGSVEKEQSQTEMETKIRMKGSDEKKLGRKEDESMEDEEGHDTSVHEAREDRLHTEEKEHHQEIRKEDENSYYSAEDGKESRHHGEEAERAVLNKKAMSTEEFPDGNDQHPMGQGDSEERMESLDKRIQEGEEGEEERSEKYHHESKERDSSHQQDREESDESEEAAEEKQAYKPKRYYRKHRMGDDSEEKRGHSGEKLAEESTEEGRLGDRGNHHQKHHHEESERHHEEKGGYHGRRGSEEVEEKRYTGRESERREGWQQSEESSEAQSKRRLHSEESNEKWHEERRHHDGSREARRHRSEGRTYGGESEEELDRYHSGGSKEEQQHRGEGRHRLQDSEDEETQKLDIRESKGHVRRHYSTEDRDSAEQQRYSGKSEEEKEVAQKHHSRDQIENEENMKEGRYAEREEYKSHLPAENEKRTTASYSPFYPLLWWKSRHLEKKDNAGEQLLESKEEVRPTLTEKNLFPEYNDYDWWEKKQILKALNHGRTEKRNPGKINRFDKKRQYNRMDQLAQLLNYRKKSAEFPELYDSGEEDMKEHHIIRNDKGNLSQRPLTEEEEKELENLAAMDLELQKIAEKFNDNRRG